MKILIIEDDKFLSEDLETLLGFYGHKCLAVNTADHFYEEYVVSKSRDYDCVILDIMMKAPSSFAVPGNLETGEQIYRIIREHSEVKICVLTAKDKEDLNIDFNKKNNSYLKKPIIDFGALISVLEA